GIRSMCLLVCFVIASGALDRFNHDPWIEATVWMTEASFRSVQVRLLEIAL
ncbi:hypothetical protein A2U01_0099421, partial [Trifolium medium]|nr:hypothetical protein [Trifolium medium]